MHQRRFQPITVCLAAVVLLHAGRSLASPEYPGELESAAGAPCPPPCTVCHLTQNGGNGTALKPFAESMIEIGKLEGEEPSLVADAVALLKSNATDSDGDGVGDIAELSAGRDPNAEGEGELCGPRYGCGASIDPNARTDLHALVALLLGLATWAARWRRRH